MKDKFDFKLEMVFRNIEELRNYHGLQQKKSEYEKKQFIKAHVGKGNNAGLVKELIRKRWWWAVSQEKIDCKLIWSQSKDKNFYLNLNDSLHNHFFYNE